VGLEALRPGEILPDVVLSSVARQQHWEERVKAGLRRAKAQGKVLGRPSTPLEISFASPCFAISFSTLYRPRLPHGSQTTVSVGSPDVRQSERVFYDARTIARPRERSKN
jgi:hypothetical protein